MQIYIIIFIFHLVRSHPVINYSIIFHQFDPKHKRLIMRLYLINETYIESNCCPYKKDLEKAIPVKSMKNVNSSVRGRI